MRACVCVCVMCVCVCVCLPACVCFDCVLVLWFVMDYVLQFREIHVNGYIIIIASGPARQFPQTSALTRRRAEAGWNRADRGLQGPMEGPERLQQVKCL